MSPDHFKASCATGGPVFQSGDAGKVIEFFAVSPTGPVNPFRTTIDSVSGGTATLHTQAYHAYPGQVAANDASFLPVLAGKYRDA